ncbi:MAG: hypothetical protein KDJ90_21680 [Nitratireductor sp.]|nr:hypothetical protein [Nitratireductor sp.]
MKFTHFLLTGTLFLSTAISSVLAPSAFAMDEHLAHNVQYAKEGQLVVINENLGETVSAGQEVIVIDDRDDSFRWKGKIYGRITKDGAPTGQWTVKVEEKL